MPKEAVARAETQIETVENTLYDNPYDDPAIIKLEREILAATNHDPIVVNSNQATHGQNFYRVKMRESLHRWENFVADNQSKAQAYKDRIPEIAAALSRLEARTEQAESRTKDSKKQTGLGSEKFDEKSYLEELLSLSDQERATRQKYVEVRDGGAISPEELGYLKEKHKKALEQWSKHINRMPPFYLADRANNGQFYGMDLDKLFKERLAEINNNVGDDQEFNTADYLQKNLRFFDKHEQLKQAKTLLDQQKLNTEDYEKLKTDYEKLRDQISELDLSENLPEELKPLRSREDFKNKMDELEIKPRIEWPDGKRGIEAGDTVNYQGRQWKLINYPNTTRANLEEIVSDGREPRKLQVPQDYLYRQNPDYMKPMMHRGIEMGDIVRHNDADWEVLGFDIESGEIELQRKIPTENGQFEIVEEKVSQTDIYAENMEYDQPQYVSRHSQINNTDNQESEIKHEPNDEIDNQPEQPVEPGEKRYDTDFGGETKSALQASKEAFRREKQAKDTTEKQKLREASEKIQELKQRIAKLDQRQKREQMQTIVDENSEASSNAIADRYGRMKGHLQNEVNKQQLKKGRSWFNRIFNWLRP